MHSQSYEIIPAGLRDRWWWVWSYIILENAQQLQCIIVNSAMHAHRSKVIEPRHAGSATGKQSSTNTNEPPS